jgi:hypothetical protein
LYRTGVERRAFISAFVVDSLKHTQSFCSFIQTLVPRVVILTDGYTSVSRGPETVHRRAEKVRMKRLIRYAGQRDVRRGILARLGSGWSLHWREI